jgi:hypothetical protein
MYGAAPASFADSAAPTRLQYGLGLIFQQRYPQNLCIT